jgi:hypothetical protein
MTQGRAAAPCAAGGLGGLGLVVAVFRQQVELAVCNHLHQLGAATASVFLGEFLQPVIARLRLRLLAKINSIGRGFY